MKKIVIIILLFVTFGSTTPLTVEASFSDSFDIENRLLSHTVKKTVTVFVGYGHFLLAIHQLIHIMTDYIKVRYMNLILREDMEEELEVICMRGM